MGPRPLSSIVPRGSKVKRPCSRSNTVSLTWTRPGAPCDSSRLAVFTVSPQTS